MEKEKDYASDSDESDEDFRPDAGCDSVSEEESNGEDSVVEGDNDNEADAEPSKTQKNVRKKGKRLTKRQSKNKRNKKDNNSDDDEEYEDETVNQASRRCTRQTDGDLTNGKKVIEKDTLESDEEDKSRTNSLWADFLKDVNPAKVTKTTTNGSATKVEENSSSSNGETKTKKDDDNNSKESSSSSSTTVKTVESTKDEPPKKKVTVTEVLDFAGEEVRIQKEVDASSIKENQAVVTAAPKMQPFGRIMPGAGIKRPAGSGTSGGGIGSLLNQIGKKKKLSVLEKSQMDWKSFKSEEGIEEELQTFNKGKDGYLERQDFLQRTDLRQFEIEKSLRQSSRRPL
ncbi:craniofacial development protein 1 [Musca vetustissima]|uniref:craniofacial development protein 1 n=1 Tax=Musca vetustissima TaxID=27455 RepID=UPI002AB5DE06|nr:craniofacial development protein 1 [Musca vetustissima]